LLNARFKAARAVRFGLLAQNSGFARWSDATKPETLLKLTITDL
jgi:hypothetical protein